MHQKQPPAKIAFSVALAEDSALAKEILNTVNIITVRKYTALLLTLLVSRIVIPGEDNCLLRKSDHKSQLWFQTGLTF